MTPLDATLLLAILAGAGALASHAHARGRWRPATGFLARLHAALLLAALLLLVVAFLASDLSYRYVWAHTHEEYPLAYRLAGVWGGEEGTILLWAAASAAFLLLVLRKGEGTDGVHRRSALLLLGFTTALASVSLLAGGFGASDPSRVALMPRGRGLADVLVTPLMVIHPPVQFLAYALMAPIAAYVAAAWIRPAGTARSPDAWASPAFAWARRAWLVSTLGLGLGALWAYYVLSFGGYWAWDPVETANLLPWLALTAFLHAGKEHLRRHGHPISAPLLAYLAFLLTLFATFATRSGLWVSVHAFTDPTDAFQPDAGLRLLGILEVHAPTRLFLGLLGALATGGMALFLLHHAPRLAGGARAYAHAHAVALLALGGAALLDPAATWGALLRAASLLPAFAPGLALVLGLLLALPPALVYLSHEERAPRRLDAPLLMGAAVALLALALGVAFVLNLQVVNRADRLLFDRRAPFLALPLVAVLTVMMALAPLGRRGALALAAAGLAAGAAGAFLLPDHRVLALAAPPLAAAALAVFLRLVHVQGRGAPWPLRAAGVLLLLASLLGLLFAGNPPTRFAGGGVPDAWAVPVGVALALLSLGALGGAIAAFRARGHAFAIAGGVAGALAFGYGLGALLALAALALLAPQRRRFRDASWRHEGVRLREAGIHLVHLALVLGLLGYAASTYSADRATFRAAGFGDEGELGTYHFHVGTARAESDAQGRLARLDVPLHLDRGGAPAGEATLTFTWAGDRYVGRLDVQRHLLADVYATPLAFHTPEGWIGADAAGHAKAPAGQVDQVSFTLAVLPLMTLVWAGLWMGVLGMGLVLAGAALVQREPRGRASDA